MGKVPNRPNFDNKGSNRYWYQRNGSCERHRPFEPLISLALTKKKATGAGCIMVARVPALFPHITAFWKHGVIILFINLSFRVSLTVVEYVLDQCRVWFCFPCFFFNFFFNQIFKTKEIPIRKPSLARAQSGKNEFPSQLSVETTWRILEK